MTRLILDGIKLKLENKADLNQDGQLSEVEVINRDTGTQDIIQNSELHDVMKELNSDNLSPTTRMSEIDMKSRLHPIEVSSVLALDALVALGVCPSRSLAFTRQKKRLAVSIDGKGRQEMVEITVGKREQDAKTGLSGMGERLTNFMTPQRKE